MAAGAGCRITDVDGNEYLDLINNYGALIHGHAHPRVVDAIETQIALGSEFGGPTEIQVRLAIDDEGGDGHEGSTAGTSSGVVEAGAGRYGSVTITSVPPSLGGTISNVCSFP